MQSYRHIENAHIALHLRKQKHKALNAFFYIVDIITRDYFKVFLVFAAGEKTY